MNTYKIISVQQDKGIINTVVEYSNGTETFKTTVTHFQPQTVTDIENGIKNRFSTEDNAIQAAKLCESLVGDIELNQVKEI
jgi:hypothetical protein